MAEGSVTPGPSEWYTDEEFIKVVGELWEISLTPHDFHHPTREFVEKIYCAFLKDRGVSLEKYDQVPPQLSARGPYPEENMGALRLVMLATDLRKYLKFVFDDDTFRLPDLYNPNAKRTRKYFSMILDFLLVKNDCAAEVEQKEEEVIALVEQREKMKARLHKLKRQINERRADNVKNQVAKKEKMRRLEAKKEELQKCQEEKWALKTQHDSLSLSLNKLGVAIKDTELMIMEANSEKRRLEGLVIQPNEEQEIKMRDEKLALLKEENQKKSDYLAQLQQRTQERASLKEMLDKLISLLKEIQQEKSKEKDLQTTYQQMVLQLTELQEDIKDQTQQNLQLTQQLRATETKLQCWHQEWDLKKESFDKEIKEKKQILEDVQREQTEQDIAYKAMTDTIANLDEQIKRAKEDIGRINATIKNNYKFILDAQEEGEGELEKALAEAAKCLEEFLS